MTRDKLKEEITSRILDYFGDLEIDFHGDDLFNTQTRLAKIIHIQDAFAKLNDSISTLLDQYHDEIAVKVQVAIESEAETIAIRVRDAIKEVPCNLSY